MNLAVLKHRLGLLEDAERFHVKALELYNYTDKALSNFAGFLRDQGRDEDAVNLLSQRIFVDDGCLRDDNIETLAVLTQWNRSKNCVLGAQEHYPLSSVSLVTALSRLGRIVDSSKILTQVSRSGDDQAGVVVSEIHLLVQYYKPNLKTRRDEIDRVLRRNLENEFITRIHVFVSSSDQLPLESDKIRIVPYEELRMTFRDALRYAQLNLQDQIVILANADIIFDDSLRRLLSCRNVSLSTCNGTATLGGACSFDSPKRSARRMDFLSSSIGISHTSSRRRIFI